MGGREREGRKGRYRKRSKGTRVVSLFEKLSIARKFQRNKVYLEYKISIPSGRGALLSFGERENSVQLSTKKAKEEGEKDNGVPVLRSKKRFRGLREKNRAFEYHFPE